ncbi:helix-turn-helix domain-containing protein [Streptomyces atrovirens]|uniref:Helix-turn-helix domain-containing protein n=1 Tax=Streptomyces atrovirens TaxID=285556 RepID=A0ABW0E2L1_9ACTN
MLRTPVDGTRLRILTLLRERDATADGLTAQAVAARLALPHPAALTHLRLLTALGLLRTDGSGARVRYRRDEARIAEVARLFEKGW